MQWLSSRRCSRSTNDSTRLYLFHRRLLARFSSRIEIGFDPTLRSFFVWTTTTQDKKHFQTSPRLLATIGLESLQNMGTKTFATSGWQKVVRRYDQQRSKLSHTDPMGS